MSGVKRSDRKGACPYCGKPTAAAHTPFCSRGCTDRDLLKWLGDGYRIAGEPADPDAEAEGAEHAP